MDSHLALSIVNAVLAILVLVAVKAIRTANAQRVDALEASVERLTQESKILRGRLRYLADVVSDLGRMRTHGRPRPLPPDGRNSNL